jgi:hypothetical protein
MSASSVITPEEELVSEKKTSKIYAPPKTQTPQKPKREPLSELFEGHEEYLGYTPD